ncbi:MAG: RNA methyltransferase [Bacilli bacterium]|nr:RNA methyltransferase [Bacilli bacterium]
MSEIITSKDNKRIKEAASYLDGKGEYFLVEGFHLVEMAVESGLATTIFTLKEYKSNVQTYIVNDVVLKKLVTTKNPEGIVALCKKPTNGDVRGSKVLYLEEVGDPGNVGTLLRTALAFGYMDVYLSKGCAGVYTPKTLMASQGAIFKLNIIESKDIPVNDIKNLKNKGFYIMATDLKSSLPPSEIDVAGKKFAIVLGNEARGVAKDIISVSDQAVRLEMSGIDSLNVGIAGGILMYLFK